MNIATILYSTILFLSGIDKNVMPETCKGVTNTKTIIKTATTVTGYKDRCDDFNDKLTHQFILLNCKLPTTSNKKIMIARRHEYCPKLTQYLFHNHENKLLQNRSHPEITLLPSHENIEQLHAQLECSQHGDVYITSSCKKSNAITIDLNLDRKDL